MLDPITGQKQQVADAVAGALTAFTENNAPVQASLAKAFPDPGDQETARQGIIDGLKQAQTGMQSDEPDQTWYTSRDAMAGIAQSAMNARVQEGAPTEAAAAFEQFGPLDPGWIECVVDGFKTWFTGKAPFVEYDDIGDFQTILPDKITIAFVSDWGAHNDAAARVSKQIRAAKPDIVIHLGDIYYAGQDDEVAKALEIWPQADPATGAITGTSFALNGNHEMFSGGKGYFGKLLAAFRQKSSYFGLIGPSWQILAFDSAYVDHRLLPPPEANGENAPLKSQWDWLLDKVKRSKVPTILLSHHQPISAFALENQAAAKLRSDYDQFVNEAGKHVYGWFFGHEHRCTIYDDTKTPYRARLIGHGCVPHPAPPPDQQPEEGCANFVAMNGRTNAQGDAVSGFALLRFNGGRIDISYIDEDGEVFHPETWNAPGM